MSKSEPKSNLEWKEWGKNDPLFGVASWPGKQKGGSAPWTDAEFYELGKSDWAVFEKEWRSYGMDSESCVEIGCGAGRMTMQLAQIFQRVTAVDVSEDMIAYARQRVAAPNVEFILVNGMSLPRKDSSTTGVFSTHVFQHFDSLEVADLYFAEIARILKPDGTMMIHMPVFEWHPRTTRLTRFTFRISELAYELKTTLNRFLIRLGMRRQVMKIVVYPMSRLGRTLAELGFTDIQARVTIAESDHSLHPFVMARKR